MDISTCAIILNYRGAEKTRRCLMSLLGQHLQTVIVVDNSADTGAHAELLQIIDDIRHAGPGYVIKVLTPENNLGFAHGVNAALSNNLTTGMGHDFYLLLNNDAVATPNLVEKLVSAMNQDPESSLAAPAVDSGTNGAQGALWYHRYFGLITKRHIPCSFPFLTGCCLIVRRDLVQNGVLFDETFFMYGEDVDLSWKVQKAGAKLNCLSDTLVIHHSGGSSRQGQLFYEYHVAHGHMILALKTWRLPIEIPLMVITKFTVLLVRAIVRSVRYRRITPIAALLLALLPLRIHAP